MKKSYFFFFLLTLCINTIFSQQSNTTYNQQSNSKDVHFNLSKVSKNVTAGLEAYNLEDLKYHARISKNAIDIVEKLLETKSCNEALDLSNSIAIYLETAILADDIASARTYLTESEELTTKAFYEYDICDSQKKNNNYNSSNEALTDLEKQQADLKAQQLALEQKAEQIKNQLAEQKVKESLLKKENFIAKNVKAINDNVKAYNTFLKACDCQETISTYTENTTSLSSKSIEQIRTYYIDETISISETYQAKLKTCKQ